MASLLSRKPCLVLFLQGPPTLSAYSDTGQPYSVWKRTTQRSECQEVGPLGPSWRLAITDSNMQLGGSNQRIDVNMLYEFARAAVPRSGWIQTTEMYPLTVLEARGPKSSCQPGHVPSEGSREEGFLVSSSVWWLLAIFGIFCFFCFFWLAAASLQCLLCITWSSYKDTSHTGLRAHPNPV